MLFVCSLSPLQPRSPVLSWEAEKGYGGLILETSYHLLDNGDDASRVAVTGDWFSSSVLTWG